MIKEYKILGVKVQVVAKHILREYLKNFLDSDTQHQIATVNPEFVVAAQKNQKFKNALNNASLATIDGTGIIQALQFAGQKISLDQRLTGVELTEIILDIAIKNNYKVMFCLKSSGLTSPDVFFMHIKEKYPNLDFQVSDENDVLYKTQGFLPEILLVGFGAPDQDLWIAENIDKVSSVRIAAGVGGTFDFMTGKQKRAPKTFRSFGLEWLWRFARQPWRIARINRAVFVFYYLLIKERLKNKEYEG